MNVGEVAALAGVTVRTLHHYDRIGLLSPSGRTAAGYRQYSPADLDRLHQVLLYRELGFPLEEVATLLDDPSADPAEHLRRQHRLLRDRLERTSAMVAAVEKEMEARAMGISLTPEERFELFGNGFSEEYAAVFRFDSAYASVSPQRSSTSASYCAGSCSPNTSNRSSGVREIPICRASISFSTAATIAWVRSSRSRSSRCCRRRCAAGSASGASSRVATSSRGNPSSR